MRTLVESFPDQVRRAMSIADAIRLEPRGGVTHVVVTGLGGSAIGGGGFGAGGAGRPPASRPGPPPPPPPPVLRSPAPGGGLRSSRQTHGAPRRLTPARP